MSDEPQEPSSPPWKNPVPFSARDNDYGATTPRNGKATNEHTADVADNTVTEPISTELTTKPIQKRLFTLLDPEEVSDEDFHEIRKLMTAFYYAQKLLPIKSRGAAPEAYRERDSALKLVIDELVPSGVVLLVIIGLTIGVSTGLINESSWMATALVAFVILLICAYFIYRALWSWQNLYRISTTTQLGLYRPENRWLFLELIDKSVSAESYATGDPHRNRIFALLQINSYLVTLDTTAQEDRFLHQMHFVRDGDRLKATAEANKRYALQD